MTSLHRRHQVLASLTRSRLLTVLRAADGSLGVRELAETVGLHANSVREQLDQLVAAGLVERSAGAAAGRGRPSLRYRALPATDEDATPYRELARALAEELALRPDARAVAVAAGNRWGRALVAGGATVPDEAEAVRRLVVLLEEAGFDPDPAHGSDAPIRLRRCPFGTLARDRSEVVCSVHLGLMRGALRELGAPLDAVRLDPYVRPDLCLAHLARADDA